MQSKKLNVYKMLSCHDEETQPKITPKIFAWGQRGGKVNVRFGRQAFYTEINCIDLKEMR